MINLIPKTEKKKKITDFYLRVLSVFLIMVGFSFLFASLALVPAFISNYYGNKTLKNNIKLQTEEPITENEKDTLDLIDELDKKITILENSQAERYSFSNRIINEILLKKGSNIKITEIVYQKDELGDQNIDVGGVASNREALLSFRRLLENNPSFKNVELPISNFVRGSNIRFSLRLVPNN